MRGLVLAVAVLLGFGVALLLVNRRAEPLPFAVDGIVIHKQAHTMAVMHGGAVMREYHVSLGRGGLLPKTQSGDKRTPEGVYTITEHNPQSSYHLALRIGYPTAEQIVAARAHGVDPGGDIMIHGIKNGFGWFGTLQRHFDWTLGCVAVTDPEIEQLFQAVPDGTRVEILP